MSNAPSRTDSKTAHGNVIGTPTMTNQKNQSRLKGDSQEGSQAGSRRNSGGNMMIRGGEIDDGAAAAPRPTADHLGNVLASALGVPLVGKSNSKERSGSRDFGGEKAGASSGAADAGGAAGGADAAGAASAGAGQDKAMGDEGQVSEVEQEMSRSKAEKK